MITHAVITFNFVHHNGRKEEYSVSECDHSHMFAKDPVHFMLESARDYISSVTEQYIRERSKGSMK